MMYLPLISILLFCGVAFSFQVIVLDQNNFKTAIQNKDTLIFVCVPGKIVNCENAEANFMNAARALKSPSIQFAKMDVTRDLPSEYKFQSNPTIVFKTDKRTSFLPGFQSKESIVNWVKNMNPAN